MPEDAPKAKIEAIRGYGGKTILIDRYTKDPEQTAHDIANENPGMTIMFPFDRHVIAGNGTIAKEIFEEVGDLDYLFVCVGYGTQLAGTCLTA